MFYEPKMVTPDKRAADSGLYRALKRREFSLFYQPQYSVRRWPPRSASRRCCAGRQPRDGVRSPDEFVPAAEESGLIVDLGGWVLEAACAQLVAWREAGLDPPRVAVNISAQQLRDQGRRRAHASAARPLSDCRATCSRWRSPKLRSSIRTAEATLEALTRLGVRLTLDDFGTGYSALGHLRRYPVRTVKIDRSFIEDVAVNPSSAALAETIIVMAHKLGKQVVAEGVETIEQLDFLREQGCDIAQGYYLARPLAAIAMAELLEGRLANGSRASAATA